MLKFLEQEVLELAEFYLFGAEKGFDVGELGCVVLEVSIDSLERSLTHYWVLLIITNDSA